MPQAARPNPLKLNRLQLRTLALLQALAEQPRHAMAGPGEGEVEIAALPAAHGDHFHVGPHVVLARDATGLGNPSVRAALVRRGLLAPVSPADRMVLTAAGRAYDTGVAEAILHRSDHD